MSSTQAELKSHGGSQQSLNSTTTVSSSGISSQTPTVPDDLEQIEVLKKRKEIMEEGIKR